MIRLPKHPLHGLIVEWGLPVISIISTSYDEQFPVQVLYFQASIRLLSPYHIKRDCLSKFQSIHLFHDRLNPGAF